MTKRSFAYYCKKTKNEIKIKNSGFFNKFINAVDFGILTTLLFGTWDLNSKLNYRFGISRVKFMSRKAAIDFFGWSLWKIVINPERY